MNTVYLWIENYAAKSWVLETSAWYEPTECYQGAKVHFVLERRQIPIVAIRIDTIYRML